MGMVHSERITWEEIRETGRRRLGNRWHSPTRGKRRNAAHRRVNVKRDCLPGTWFASFTWAAMSNEGEATIAEARRLASPPCAFFSLSWFRVTENAHVRSHTYVPYVRMSQLGKWVISSLLSRCPRCISSARDRNNRTKLIHPRNVSIYARIWFDIRRAFSSTLLACSHYWFVRTAQDVYNDDDDDNDTSRTLRFFSVYRIQSQNIFGITARI